jgi:MFS family permease
MTVMATFLTKYGLTSAGAESGVAGTFTMFYFAATAVGSIVGGLISDRRGVIVPFRVFPLFVAAACVLSAFSPKWGVVSAAWGLLGFGWGMWVVAVLPAIFRFAGPHRRPSYSAVFLTGLGVAAAVLPPLLGIAVDAGLLSFPHVFLLSGAAALAGWLLFLGMPTPDRASPAVPASSSGP